MADACYCSLPWVSNFRGFDPLFRFRRWKKVLEFRAEKSNQSSSCSRIKELFMESHSKRIHASSNSVKMWKSLEASKSIAKDDVSSKDELLSASYHVVRKGETLTSVAKKYATSLEENVFIYVNENACDKVPPETSSNLQPSETLSKLQHVNNNESFKKVNEDNSLSTKFLEVSSFPVSIKLVKPMTPLLLFLPLVIYCISFLVRLPFRNGLSFQGDFVKENIPKRTRWHGVLDSEDNSLEATSSEIDSHMGTLGIHGADAPDDTHQSYAELESTYMKFLADCGLSQTGYWRGGVPGSISENKSNS